MKTLRAKNIVKIYKGRKVVKGISLEVNQGEIIGLLGPNGAGKTTSFYMIVGFIKPNDGHIYLNNMEITKFPMYKRAQNGIGYLAQEPSVFRKLSIEDNILSVLQLTKLSKKEQLYKMESLIDEPFAGVDPIAVEDIQNIVFQLKNKNIGILITDHRVEVTLPATDRTYLMYEGGILKAGLPEELAYDPMVREVYLGNNFELKKRN